MKKIFCRACGTGGGGRADTLSGVPAGLSFGGAFHDLDFFGGEGVEGIDQFVQLAL